ncbi:MAG: SDR family NAD(P)-dependent oxidoreductase [Solirubrobacterales bacterium]
MADPEFADRAVGTDLRGRVGIVTGASKGIGQAVTLAAAAAGATVLAVSRGEAALEETVARAEGSPGTVVPQVLDVGDEAGVAGAVARVDAEFGGLDFIVNNAGLLTNAAIGEITDEDWTQTEAVNVRGVLWGCKYAVRSMLERKSPGSIINIGSTSSLAGWGDAIAYTMSKHAVLGLTRAIAADRRVSGVGIRTVCVCPGDVLTPLAEEWLESQPDPEGIRTEMEGLNPSGRLALPEEVADLVIYLCSTRASLLNGQAIVADLGQRALLM